MNYSFTLKSSNAKTGPIPVTYSPRETCPGSCPYIDDGCYADAGWYTRMHWDKISEGSVGVGWNDLMLKISNLPDGTLWRHNIAGDLPTYGHAFLDMRAVYELVEANWGKRGFTYTHHELNPWNAEVIARANIMGFTVNISTDSPEAADRAFAMAIGPVCLVVPSTQTKNFKTPAGNRVVICPATQRDDVTCATCKLCAVPGRTTIIGFPAHGGGTKKVDAKVVRFYR